LYLLEERQTLGLEFGDSHLFHILIRP